MDIEWVAERVRQIVQLVWSECSCLLQVARSSKKGQARIRVFRGGEYIWSVSVNCVGDEVVLVWRSERTGVMNSLTLGAGQDFESDLISFCGAFDD